MPPDADIEAQRAALAPKEFDSHTLILLRWADSQPELSEDALGRPGLDPRVDSAEDRSSTR